MHGGTHGGGFHGGGFAAPGSFGGLHGISSIAFGQNDPVAFIGGGASGSTDGTGLLELEQVGDGSFPTEDVVVQNRRHGKIDPFDLFIFAMDVVGFRVVKVCFDITGQQPVVDTGWIDGILPVTAWIPPEDRPDNGPLPGDIGDRGGKSRMFRYFCQVVEKEWWFALYEPKHEPDRVACCYLDVVAMAWWSAQFGDYQSELMIRLPKRSTWHPEAGAYMHNIPAVNRHRRAQWLGARKFNELVRRHEPSAESKNARLSHQQAQAEGSVALEQHVIAPPVKPKPETVKVKIYLPARPRPRVNAPS